MRSPLIESLIKQFAKFPTVGPRQAGRFVYYLVDAPQKDIDELVSLLSKLKQRVRKCALCFYVHEEEGERCAICKGNRRDRERLCVVEKEADLESIEKTGAYKGLYFVLGGTLSPLKKDLREKLRGKELIDRIQFARPPIKEVIIATNATSDGEATALYLREILRPLGVTTTRIGRGIPVGGELEYADEETLLHAFENRK